ncbi:MULTISPECIES: FCD domain-containing protein [unclassified Diaminobutyricimonas]|uniref:FadR/GntR family transcriptional regulator n=1 Tax=unclassified Diaminobutyricimonas TaxID=2643261 RepID=UPI0012F4B50B|nr:MULTISPECIES: FCD domain-containing protein [unclassified Diaminobutyricimonas]
MTYGDSRPEVVARRIAEMVRSLPSGARLGSKKEIQAIVGVSEGTLNTTLRLLQTRGLIRVRSGPGGGVFAVEQSPIARLGNAVLELDSDDIDIPASAQVRNGLEYEVINDACEYRTNRDLKDIDVLLADMRDAVGKSDDDRFIHANWMLHRRIAQVTPNLTLSSLYVGLLDTIEAHTLRIAAASGQDLQLFHAERLQIHEALVDTIRTGDPDAAVSVVHTHNRGIRADTRSSSVAGLPRARA